jgi:hypothetical protein
MKTKYIKGITALGLASALFFSSCLKDSRYFNPETVPNLAELPLSGLAHFSNDAVTGAGIDTVTFAVGVTAANPPTTSTAITLAVDNTLITTYNAANTAITYQPMPTAAFKLNANVTIPAGKNSTLTTVIIDRTQLDPAVSYMLPVKVASASGLPISANYGVHYYHIIGNDFAGAYKQNFQRYNAADSVSAALNSLSYVGHPATFSPISPTEFEVYTGYDGGTAIRYDVTFTKTGNGSSAVYTNFNVILDAGDVASVALPANGGITFPVAPVFLSVTPNAATLPGPYTFAQAKKLFHFVYTAQNSSGFRYIVDTFY